LAAHLALFFDARDALRPVIGSIYGTNAFPGGWFGLERRADVMSGNIYE
jgi:hypothetical protein